jgi:hypothetical protein
LEREEDWRPLWYLCREPKFEGKCSGLYPGKILDVVKLIFSRFAPTGFRGRKPGDEAICSKRHFDFIRPLQTSFISPPFNAEKRIQTPYFEIKRLWRSVQDGSVQVTARHR